jgi:hypothetical protein
LSSANGSSSAKAADPVNPHIMWGAHVPEFKRYG